MAQHKRRHRQSQAQDGPLPSSADGQTARPNFARSSGIVLLVALLIVCYVVLFYGAHGFRQQILSLLFVPDVVMRSWGANGELALGMVDRLPLLAVALGILAIAWASGSLFVRGWKLDARLTRLETELFSIGLGLSLWSIWTLLVGLMGLLAQTWLVWLPAVPIASLAGFQMAARRAELTEPRAPTNRSSDWLWPSMLLLGVPFVLLYVLAAVLPPRPMLEFDVMEYHLQVPKEWFAAGRITFLPHNVYGNMPLGAEMFSLLGMTLMPGEDGWWYGALVGKTIMGLTPVLTALLLYAAGKRLGSTTAGVVSALVYLSTPWIHLVSVTGRNEGVLAFYLALAVYAVWLWRREPSESEPSPVAQLHFLKLAGFFAGSAAAVKYTAVPLVVLPLLLAVAFAERRFAWRPAAIFLVGALAACGLWYAKNAALAGNPVYPLAGSLFGGETRTPEKIAQWQNAHRVPPYSLGELASESQRLLIGSTWLSPLLVPLAALALLAVPHRRTAFWLAALLVFYLVGWFLFTHRLDRFWVPAIVLVAWLAGIGATWSTLGAWRHILVTLLFWGLVSNFLVIASAWYVPDAEEQLADNRFAVSLASLREANLSAAHRYLNEHCPRGYSVLLVGAAQPFDLTVPTLYNTSFDDVWFDRLLKDRDRSARQKALREQKIAYVLVHWGEIERYRSPGNYGFSDYITRELVSQELVKPKLWRKVLASRGGEWEIYEVIGAVPLPE